MDAAALAAVISALGLGGVGGALLRAEQDRTERFRDRMIDIAEQFLSHTAAARSGLTTVSRAITDHDPADRDSVEAVRIALRDADEAIQAAEGVIPSLSVIFPSLPREEMEVWEAAALTVHEFTNALHLLNDTTAWTADRRQAIEQTRLNLTVRQGEFAGVANREIWRRWFFRPNRRRRLRAKRAAWNKLADRG